MNLDAIIENKSNGEPIFISDIPIENKNYLRQEFKRLADCGILKRLYNGVYYKNYKTVLGTEGRISIDKFINKMYLENNQNGFYTGLYLANKYGFTTQMPSYIEVTSNKATTKQRKYEVDGFRIIVYKPVTEITEDNFSSLQFLDLMMNIDKYSELKGEELKNKLKEFVTKTNVNFNYVKKYLSLYPACVYKNIYEGGLMNELV